MGHWLLAKDELLKANCYAKDGGHLQYSFLKRKMPWSNSKALVF
jgi:hypothetical protein